jgi:hypothetical protein
MFGCGAPVGPRRGESGASFRIERKVRPVMPVSTTTTPLGAEFLVEHIIGVFLSALLEFHPGIGFYASAVVVGSRGCLVRGAHSLSVRCVSSARA